MSTNMVLNHLAKPGSLWVLPWSSLIVSSTSTSMLRNSVIWSTGKRHFRTFISRNENEKINNNTLAAKPVPVSYYKDLYKPDDYHLSPSWIHPNFAIDQLKSVPVAHLQPKTISDEIALWTLRFMRWSFDKATGYKHPPKGQETNPKYAMTEHQWLRRFVFLESIAGVPGMVGGMVRHLHSLRLLKRDRAWIETLLEEAYNERMHLMTLIKLTKPSWLMKFTLLGAQGVFFTAFMTCYLLVPRICHRFIGYLEEEAVVTYTRCIEDFERGLLPDFANTPAPDIALQYWHMPEDATVKDLIYYIRADECKHREVNHTFGNLIQRSDPNPYALDLNKLPESVARPTKDLKYHNTHPVGWTRNEIYID